MEKANGQPSMVALIAAVAGMAALGTGTQAGATSVEANCQEQKLKAQGQLKLCRKRAPRSSRAARPKYRPLADETQHDGLRNYWSSIAAGSASAWILSFGFGGVSSGAKTWGWRRLCPRRSRRLVIDQCRN